MTKPFKILFVCTDNVGRSVIAEYCLRDYLKKNNVKNVLVSSAGTNASSDTSSFSFAHFDELKKLGIDCKNHKRQQLTRDVIGKFDLIVPMAKNHQEWIEEKFDLKSSLFNDIYKRDNSSIIISKPSQKNNLDDEMVHTTHYIHKAIPIFFKNISF